MKELIYQVEFKSDIVLPATSNTEGNIQNLDFIAGSNFLGMVAREYGKFENSFDIFHSGRVRFGDATILKDNQPTYKMPLSYFHEKGEEKQLFNHHLLRDEDFKKFDQLKQKRNGYITKDLEVVEIDYNYSQKSAYNKTKRRSLDGSMFGYSAMKKGLKWQFSIKIDKSISKNDIELIKKTILKSNRLGKSKSAQYGLIKIKFIGSEASASLKGGAKSPLPNQTILYFKSRVALIDENTNPTYDLKYICNNANIDYSKSQIKTSSFTPYNGAMQTKTYERVVINKGSVVVLNDLTNEQKEEIENGVGIYLAEGFGEILINPSFLSKKELEFNIGNVALASSKGGAKAPLPITPLAKFLQQREDNKKEKLYILNEVDDFIKNNKTLYKNIKPSQWGKIRSICTSGNGNFEDEIEKYISNGTKKWEQRQIEIFLEIFKNKSETMALASSKGEAKASLPTLTPSQIKDKNIKFIKLLSIQMPKGAKNEN